MSYPVIEKGAKVGIHALQASSFQWVEEAVRRGITWPVVKSVGDVAWLAKVKEISPQTITVARLAHNDEGRGEGLTGIEYIENGDYSAYVDMLFGSVLRTIRNNPQLKDTVDYWEISNEPDPPDVADSLNSATDPDGYRKMAECMIACMIEADKHDIKLALFALNAGTPEWYEIDSMIQTGVFKRAQAGGHIISLHEGVFINTDNNQWGEVDQWYGGAIPTIDQHNPQTKWVQLNGNKFTFKSNDDPTLQELPKTSYTAGALNFRYRFWLQRLRDIGQAVPFLVSEIRLGATEQYQQRLPWYDERAAQDPELLGYLPFTWSPYNTGDWGDANMDHGSGVILNYMQQVQNRQNALPSSVEPPAPTPPVTPTPPVVEPPNSNDAIQDVFDTVLGHPTRLHVPPNSGLHRRVESDGLRAASTELRMEIQGVDSIALLASDSSYQLHALYYVAFGDWRDEAIQVYDPNQLIGGDETVTFTPPRTPPSEPVYPTAIDTSKFRPNINYASKVKLNEQGIYCVMPRASTGKTPDPEFIPTMNQLMLAKARGERIVIIPFHDINPWYSADEQAAVFQSQVSKFGGWRAWMFDVEQVPHLDRPLPTEAKVQAFVNAVEQRIGIRPKLYYSSKRYIDRVSETNTFGADLMVAAYGAKNPALPTCFKRIGKSWTFHQHTDRYFLKGYTDKVSGPHRNDVDRSFFQGTVEELFDWEKHNPQPVVTPVDPEPHIEPIAPIRRGPVRPPIVQTRAERINLLPYWKGKIGWAHNLRSFMNGHENNETVQTIQIDDNSWGILKNRLMQRYFLREYQGRQFIWQGPDSSPGNNRFYVTYMQQDIGSPVCPVEMAVGEEWRNDKPHWVQFFDLSSGHPSRANSGPWTNWIKLHAHHPQMTFVNGIVLKDVIEIGNNETHLLARDRTLVGWSRDHHDPHTPKSAGVSELHAPFSRRPEPLDLPHFAMPQSAKPF